MLKNELNGNRIFTLEKIITEQSCKLLIDRCNLKGWNDSSPSGVDHGRSGEEASGNKFCILYDDSLAKEMMGKVVPYLPSNLEFLGENTYFQSATKGNEWVPSFIYNKLRICKYEEGTSIPQHFDYKVKRTIIRKEQEYVQQSFLSILVYLNDDFEGGNTGYWPDNNDVHCPFLKNSEKQCSVKDYQIVIRPKAGMAVVQDQNILHEEMPTKKGNKYILRSDIIYERELIQDPRIEKEYKTADWERLVETSCINYED